MRPGALSFGLDANGRLLAGAELHERLAKNLAGNEAGFAALERDRFQACAELHHDLHLLSRLAAAIHLTAAAGT